MYQRNKFIQCCIIHVSQKKEYVVKMQRKSFNDSILFQCARIYTERPDLIDSLSNRTLLPSRPNKTSYYCTAIAINHSVKSHIHLMYRFDFFQYSKSRNLFSVLFEFLKTFSLQVKCSLVSSVLNSHKRMTKTC